MNLVIFLGPPGVGKGTQCSLLRVRLNFEHISTGNIIRQEIQSQSELGLRVRSIVESGNLVDDKAIFLCLEKALAGLNHSDDNLPVLLDGLPRNINQAYLLDDLIQKMKFKKVQVICLEADVERLVERFQSRFTCKSCGNVESIQLKLEDFSPLQSYQCKSCGSVGTMFRRKDDEPSTVRHRLNLYQQETFPLINFYEKRGIINFVDGLMPPESVYEKVVSYLI